MRFLASNDPIIACSTCTQSNAAIALIRISGFNNLEEFRSFFSYTGPIEPRKVYFTPLVLQGQRLDDVCLTYFAAPKSYNGENILELSIHGNTLNIERIIELFVTKANCRLASPGEFTYRALRNKKLSLSQVEGLDLFLNANSGHALDQGLSLLSGNLHQIYSDLYDLFLKHKSALELSIDFSDDIGEQAAKDYFQSTLSSFSEKFSSLLRRTAPLDYNLLRPEIVLAGLPNSGKSTLFNFLLRDERSIVSSTPGTTRDYISETIVFHGVRYRLIDTAGLREATDLIEAEGIKRTRLKIQHSFFSLLLINPFEMRDDFVELTKIHFDGIYFTHQDLPGFDQARQAVIDQFPSLTSAGSINLKILHSNFEMDMIEAVNKKYLLAVSAGPLLLDRHKHLITEIARHLDKYQFLCQAESDVGILSHELNTLASCLSELLGIVSPDQVLNSIFSNFCIGK